MPRKEWRLYLDDHLGDLDVGLFGGDQILLVTAFPLKYTKFHKTYFRNYRKPIVYNNLDEEHDLA